MITMDLMTCLRLKMDSPFRLRGLSTASKQNKMKHHIVNSRWYMCAIKGEYPKQQSQNICLGHGIL